MLYSFPARELPLQELLEDAAKQGITAALDLRSDLAVGRIDIVDGQIVEAVFGGLEREEAVYAALRCDTLRVQRGRNPKKSAARTLALSIAQLVSRRTQNA